MKGPNPRGPMTVTIGFKITKQRDFMNMNIFISIIFISIIYNKNTKHHRHNVAVIEYQ